MPDGHLDSDRSAAYAERRLSAAERTLVESHLAECDACRREASSVAILVQRERRRRRLLVAGPVAVAALVMLVVFTRSGGDGLPADSNRLRPGGDSTLERPSRLEALLPEANAEIGRDSLRFHWRPIGRDALYLVVLTDSAGQTVWEGRLTDTVLALPPSVSLLAGTRYIWLVDVLLSSGGTATTGPREFRIRP